MDEQDRRSKTTMASTGRNGIAEEKHFRGCLDGFEEMFQEAMTYEGGTTFSRIDRIYTNQHAVETIDREMYAAAMEWRLDLPTHRPVYACRRLPDKSSAGFKPISPDMYTHPDFTRRVRLEWRERSLDTPGLSGLGLLRLLKSVMRGVSRQLARSQTGLQEATELEDQLGVVMRSCVLPKTQPFCYFTVPTALLGY